MAFGCSQFQSPCVTAFSILLSTYMRKSFLFGLIGAALFLTLGAHSAFAVRFELVPPTGDLSRGQDVTFTLNIDTEGESVTTMQTGMTYNTSFLEYVSAAAGSAMDSISVDSSLGGGKLILNGTKAGGFTGTGVYATVVLKIIAASPGSTELCTLWVPELTPTPAPQCNNACTTNTDCPSNLYCYIASGQTTGFCRMQSCPEQTSCACPLPTTPPPPPQPTALPQTGYDGPKNTGMVAGIIFMTIATGIFFYTKQTAYTKPASHPHKKHEGSK
jgi:hypothetical protein